MDRNGVKVQTRKTVVIGGAGFIGSHVVEALEKEKAGEIVALDNLSNGDAKNLDGMDCELCIGSILDDSLDEVIAGADVVFHLAATWLLECQENSKQGFYNNVEGTYRVAKACIKHGVKKLVYSSSASVYGDAVEIPMPESHPLNNYTFYGATKIAGEHIIKSLARQHGLSWLGLRYMNVYGPRMGNKGVYNTVIEKMMQALEAGNPIELYGDGSQTYDFIDVRDVARANLLAAKSDKTDACYNVGTGIGTTLLDLALMVEQCYSKEGAEIRYLSDGKTFVTKRIGCPKLAKAEIGFEAEIKLRDGLKEFMEWRKSR
jgi:UDP-glucose 4-epimerase